MNILTAWEKQGAHLHRSRPPEPNSFNGALTRAAQGALSAAGHEVVVSDLYAIGFNPVSDAATSRPFATRTTTASSLRERMRPPSF